MELTEGERGAAAAPGRRGRGRHVAAGAAAAPGRRGRAPGRARPGQSPVGTGPGSAGPPAGSALPAPAPPLSPGPSPVLLRGLPTGAVGVTVPRPPQLEERGFIARGKSCASAKGLLLLCCCFSAVLLRCAALCCGLALLSFRWRCSRLFQCNLLLKVLMMIQFYRSILARRIV